MDEQLLAAALAGDEQALHELLGQYRDQLVGIASRELGRQLKSKLSASDVVQQTMLEAHRDFHTFRGDGEFLAWVRGILRNNIRRERERYSAGKRDVEREQCPPKESAHARTLDDVAHNGSTPSSVVNHKEQREQIHRLIDELPNANWQAAVRMRFFDGKDLQQIGRQLGCTRDAAAGLLRRGLEHMRRQSELLDFS